MTSARPVFPITPEVEKIGRAIAEAGGRPILVGGWVRDCLLGHPHSKDFDIEVFSLPTRELQDVLAKFGPVHTVGRHFGVLKLSTRAAEYDVSVPRRESKIGKGHREFEVVADPGMSFTDAAARRDFTINSIGFAFLENEILDPFQGREDLAKRLLRHTGPAFGEDPLRVLRAMQLAGRFKMTVAEETIRICLEQDLSELPRERLWEEFRKLLLISPVPSHGLRYVRPLGILPYFPELAALEARGELALDGDRFDAWQRTLDTIDRATLPREPDGKADLARMLAALTHLFGALELETPPVDATTLAAAGEAPLRRFLRRLTRESGLSDQVWAIVRDWPTPERLYATREQDSNAEVRRLALRVPIPALLAFARARYEAAHGAEALFEAGEWLTWRARTLGVLEGPPEPLLKGRHLMELGLRPGPEMGEILRIGFDYQLDGLLDSLDQALRWAEEEIAARKRA